MAAGNEPIPDDWRGVVTDEEWQVLKGSLSEDRLRDLLVALRECPPDTRTEMIAEVRGASSFRDRSVGLALARVFHDLERPPT